MKKLLLVLAVLLCAYSCPCQNIAKEVALADVEEFVQLLKTQSSYFQYSDYDFENSFERLRARIAMEDSIPIHVLAYEMEKIVAEMIDRHASVRAEDFDEDEEAMFDLHLPFAVAPLNGQVVALVRNRSAKQYEYYSQEYPFLKSINGLPVLEFIEQYAYRRKNAPTAAMLYDGVKDLRDIGELFFKQGDLARTEIDVVLTNGESDKAITLPLSEEKHKWINVGHTQDLTLIRAMYLDEPFDYDKLDQWLADSIAYLQIPAMFDYDDFAGFDTYLWRTMEKYRNAQALIIDLRNNGGGTREILQTMAGYIVPPEQAPWVANVAYIRNDQQLNEDIESMSGRYLYSYDSDKLSDADREAIDVFEQQFQTDEAFDQKKFSQPFYMVLNSKNEPLECPIYILVDEQSFSAASVFTSAFKGLKNVTIAGVTTNGSSGRSRVFYLGHSNIRIKLSTMLSFQRNGKTLDGNGTEPDLVIERDELQVLGKRDTQLEKLVDWIKNH